MVGIYYLNHNGLTNPKSTSYMRGKPDIKLKGVIGGQITWNKTVKRMKSRQHGADSFNINPLIHSPLCPLSAEEKE